MSLITEYTTFDEVRAALGVSPEDLEDAQIDLPMFASILEVELEDIHVNLPTVYAATKALSTLTAAEERFLKGTHLFATYALARQLTTTLPLFSPEQVTDGKAAYRRPQAGTPYQKVIDAVHTEYDRFRKRLETLFAEVNASAVQETVAKVYLSVVSPAADPITGV